jgi:hypothetical protein
MSSLEIGESSTVISVSARNPWNDSGIDLAVGAKYTFAATGLWKDACIECGPEGYESTPLLKLFERFRRVPNARYFKLIGTIGRTLDDFIIIGSSLPHFAPPRDGQLYCFANDVRLMYWNNAGCVELRVTRTA